MGITFMWNVTYAEQKQKASNYMAAQMIGKCLRPLKRRFLHGIEGVVRMGVKRIVDVSFWTDNKVDEFSPEDKFFMLYLLTNPFTTQLGIYEISIKQAAFQMGYSIDAFNVLLDRFETKYRMIVYSKETGEIAIKNFLRHSIIKGGKPVEDCIKRDMSKVKNRKLLDFVFSSISGKDDLNETVKKIISEYEHENDIHNDNDNDNDNEVSYHDSYYDSYYAPNQEEKKPPKPSKHKHGEYNNVLLTDDEMDKLKAEYPDWADRIERLSSYVASTGKRYKSHYATIRNWARKDKEKSKGNASMDYGDPEDFYK